MVVILWKLDLQLPVQSVPMTTKDVSLNPSWQGVIDITLCVNDLQQIGGFLWVLLFPPPIKLTATI
jgi:hypothetical protein